jgi:hypothetical protein
MALYSQIGLTMEKEASLKVRSMRRFGHGHYDPCHLVSVRWFAALLAGVAFYGAAIRVLDFFLRRFLEA